MRRSRKKISPDFVKFQFCDNVQNQLDDPPHFTYLKFGDPPPKKGDEIWFPGGVLAGKIDGDANSIF